MQLQARNLQNFIPTLRIIRNMKLHITKNLCQQNKYNKDIKCLIFKASKSMACPVSAWSYINAVLSPPPKKKIWWKRWWHDIFDLSIHLWSVIKWFPVDILFLLLCFFLTDDHICNSHDLLLHPSIWCSLRANTNWSEHHCMVLAKVWFNTNDWCWPTPKNSVQVNAIIWCSLRTYTKRPQHHYMALANTK